MKRTLLVLLVAAGCVRATTPPVTTVAGPEFSRIPIRSIAVITAEVSDEKAGISEDARGVVTDLLIEALSRQARWQVIPPSRVEAPSGDRSHSARAGRDAQRVGADVAVTAVVSRYSERVGSDYGVSEPASVALTMLLVAAGDSEPVWKAEYSFTQEPLAYNLWNFWGIVRGGPKWMTARELARIGVDEAMSRLGTGQ